LSSKSVADTVLDEHELCIALFSRSSAVNGRVKSDV